MSPRERSPGWVPSLALLAGVVLAGALAARLAPDGRAVATFWPAAGLGLLALLVAPPRRWWVLGPLLAAAIAAGDVLGDRGWRLGLPHGACEALVLVLGALLVTRGGRHRPRLRDQEDVARLVGAAVLSGASVALAGGFGQRVVEFEPLWPSIAASTTSHVAGVLVLVPLGLVGETRVAGRRHELVAQVLLLTAACVLLLVPDANSTLAFVPVLLLAWAALRFDLRVACAELALLGVVVTAQTVAGAGPFGDGVDTDRYTALTGGALSQGFLVCAALLVLPLGIEVRRNTVLLQRITADSRLFRRNFTESLVGMAFLEPDATGRDLVVADLNDTALAILGGTEESLVGARLGDAVHLGPEYAAALPQLLDGRLEGWRGEGPLSAGRSGQVTLQISSLGEHGDAPFFAAQLLDVTAEHDARRALEAAQTLTNATLDTTNCIIMVTDLDGVVVRVNHATTAITGFRQDELLGRAVWETGIAPVDAHDVEALFLWPNRSEVPVAREADATTKTGDRLRIVWNTTIVRDPLGSAMYAVMTGIDVTAERTTAGLVNHLMQASLTTAIVGIDNDGRISVANSGISQLLGYERDELVGEPFHRLLETSELLARTGADTPDEAFATLVRGLGPDGETRSRDWTWRTATGVDRLVSMSLSVAQDAFAAQTGYLCVARDVTEQRHSQEVLIAALDKERTAVERLQALDQAKSEFISTVSHELRTPVTSIVGYAEMMADGSIVPPHPEQVPLLETIERNGQRLIAMINDLLTLSGFDSETVQPSHDLVDLAAVVGPAEDAVRPLARGRGLHLEVERPESSVPVLGDQAQLERVVMNLLSNAVKFTEDGGTVGLAVTTEDGEAVIRVCDTGIGIPAEEQAELFQRFFRSSTVRSRQIQGTGLGLSIVAAIVEGHGGSIDVTSAHLQGSVFTVRLPLASVAEPAPAR